MEVKKNSLRNRAGMIVSPLALMALTGLTVTACGGASETNAEFTSAAVQDKPIIHETFEANGGMWILRCFGPEKTMSADFGDTLLDMAHEAGTFLQEDMALGRKQIPVEVFAQALGVLNRLPDPDVIVAGNDYSFPAVCETKPVI